MANAAAKPQPEQTFEIVHIEKSGICSRRTQQWYVDLRRPADGKVVTLRQCIYWRHGPPDMVAGNVICARVRSSVFGSLVDSFSQGACGTFGFEPARRDFSRAHIWPTDPWKGRDWTGAPAPCENPFACEPQRR